MHLGVGMLALPLFHRCAPTATGYREVFPEQLASARQTGDAPRIIDVREESEYRGELGHIAGAELVPLVTLSAACTPWDRGEELVVVCRSGARSSRAAEMLVRAGFTRVLNLTGGMLAYNASRLPVERQ